MSTSVVLITGALTGIGRAAAIAFATKGAKVVVSGRRDEAGKALAKELRALGSEAEFINADVRKEDDVRALVDKTVARFGRLDVAVNNAATGGQVGPITDQTAESFAATFETNVLGVVLSMKHEVLAMQAQRQHHQRLLDLWARGRGLCLDLRRRQARRRRHHQVGGARDRQVGNPCERRRAWPH
jgi:NAD(P)-dependent dehydrogenase (short-subunit alcohol dehydrogenase family)